MHLNTVVAFAAEGGIVPALPLVRRLLAREPSDQVLMFYGNYGAHPAEAIEEFLALKDLHLDRLSLSFVMEREPDEAELLSGRLDEPKVRSIATKMFDAAGVKEYFVCGSGELAAAVTGALSKLGVPAERVHIEGNTGPSAGSNGIGVPHVPAKRVPGVAQAGAALETRAGTEPGADQETRVAVVMDGRRRSFAMRTGTESILDAAARAGVELPFSCKAGVCSTCRTKLVRGKVELAENHALEDWELEAGFILACQAHAKTPEIEITYDET